MEQALKAQLVEFKAQKNRLMGRLLGRSFRFLTDLSSERLRAMGYETFRLGHMISLVHLDLEGSTINEMAAQTGITKQAVSKLVKELQEEGYVETEKHPDDARSTIVRITDKGGQFMLDWRSCTDHIDAEFQKILGKEKLATLKDLLFVIVDHYEKQQKTEEKAASTEDR